MIEIHEPTLHYVNVYSGGELTAQYISSGEPCWKDGYWLFNDHDDNNKVVRISGNVIITEMD
jgi:hypothetical protein